MSSRACTTVAPRSAWIQVTGHCASPRRGEHSRQLLRRDLRAGPPAVRTRTMSITRRSWHQEDRDLHRAHELLGRPAQDEVPQRRVAAHAQYHQVGRIVGQRRRRRPWPAGPEARVGRRAARAAPGRPWPRPGSPGPSRRRRRRSAPAGRTPACVARSAASFRPGWPDGCRRTAPAPSCSGRDFSSTSSTGVAERRATASAVDPSRSRPHLACSPRLPMTTRSCASPRSAMTWPGHALLGAGLHRQSRLLDRFAEVAQDALALGPELLHDVQRGQRGRHGLERVRVVKIRRHLQVADVEHVETGHPGLVGLAQLHRVLQRRPSVGGRIDRHQQRLDHRASFLCA